MSIYKQSYPFAYAPASLAAVTSASHKSMFAAFNIDVNDFVLLNVTALSLFRCGMSFNSSIACAGIC